VMLLNHGQVLWIMVGPMFGKRMDNPTTMKSNLMTISRIERRLNAATRRASG